MIEEIPKINLDDSPKAETPPIKKKKLGILLIGLVIFIFILIFALLLPVKNIYGQTVTAYQTARETYQAIKNQDLDKASTNLKATKGKFLSLQKSYQVLSWTGFIPILGAYWRDGDHLIKAGLAGIQAGETSIEAIAPYADLLGLKGKSSFVLKSTDERIQTAVATLDKLTPKIGEISEALEIINNEVKDIDPNRYPPTFLKFAPRVQIEKFKSMTEELTGLFISARPLLQITPSLLGEKDPKRYLVIFQNDKELRPTGGFMTAYAIFIFDKGKMKVEESGDIYKLDQQTSIQKKPPQPFIDHLNVYKLYLRDTNFEPDFAVSMKQFDEVYATIRGKGRYDGIIAVDTHVLVEAMKILGPIPAYGANFTADPDIRCGGCPNVIYELEDYAGKRVGYVREDRKDIIGVLLYQIMQKALGVSPGKYWGKLFQMSLAEVAQKHILVFLHDSGAQSGVEAFNMGGRIKGFEGDYLHINDANLGGAKSNMFVRESVKVDYQSGSDGTITKTVTINYKNPQPGSPGCNLETGGLCLNGPMPDWLRVYVPKGSALLEFKGSEDKATSGEALGKTVFSGFLTINPLGTAQVVVKYKLPFKASGKDLPVLIQKQPGTDNNEYTINVNGTSVEKFNLTTDKEFKIKL